MPLQVSPQIFKWLQGLALVKQAKRNQNALMEINEHQINKFIDGYVFAVIFRSLFKSRLEQQKLKKLDSLKEHSTPAIRLYNWGILAELLKQVGYALDLADKSKITNYEPEPLAKVLTFLFEIKAKDTSQKTEENSLNIDIQQIGKKTLLDSINTLEFLTISIAKNFKISPQQTLNLFLDNNKYLSHLLAKGVKNSFDPVYNLMDELLANVQFIVSRLFCLDEQQNVNFLLNALRSCLIGKDLLVAEKMCEFLSQIYEQYKTEMVSLQFMRKWIQTQGINTLFFCIKKQVTLASMVFEICFNYLDDQFFKYIQLSEKSILWNSELERLVFYKVFVDEASEAIFKRFSISGQFDAWNRLFLKTMKKTKEKKQILLVMAIMEEQWNKMGSKFQQNDLGLPNQYINFIRNVITMNNQLLFLQSARILFSLMQSLGVSKNSFAPLIYKILVNAYGTFGDLAKIVYMSDNFIVSFRNIHGLPGGPLIQPLIKHLQNNREWPVIQLATVLIEENRVEEEASVDIIEMLTKIAFSDIRFGGMVLDSIFSSLQYMNEQIVGQFLESNVQNCLAQLYSLSKSISKSIKLLKQQLQNLRKHQGDEKANAIFVNAASKHILCKNMIGFIAKSTYMDENLKDMMEAPIFHTYIKIKKELKKQEQAQLLKPIMISYCSEEQQLEPKILYYMNQAYPPKPPQSRRGHSHNHLSKSVAMRPSTTQQQEQRIPVLIDPSQLKPSEFALKDLQKVKKRRYELKIIEVERQKEKAAKDERIEKFKTIQHQKRLVESMNTIKNDVVYNNIQTIESRPKLQPETHQSKQIQNQANNIRLLSLQKQQEQPYRQDAQSVLKKYKKVWRYLFFKYSTKKTQNGGEEKVHQGEAWKMLKDYDFNFLKKDQCFTFVRLINQQMKRKNDIQFLTYQGFQDYILQISVAGYGKIGYDHLPPGKTLQLFVEQLKKVTKDKSGSVQIFENPEEAYFQETEVVRQFNKRLKQNPDYILPEGYKRVKQTSLEFEYDVHPMSQKNICTPYVQVLQILDSIIAKHPKLGFHLIQPLSIKSETYLAKPFLFQNINNKLKQYSKGYLQPKRSISVMEKNKSILSPSPVKKQFKPYVNFSLGIKLGLAQTNVKSKSIAEQVAYCMEDILNAVQSQSPVVRKGRKKITNEFMRRRRIEYNRLSTEKIKNEVNWKKRADSVKLEVEALRQKRKQADKQKKRKQFIDKKAKKQKQEKINSRKMTEFEKAKAKIAQKRQALLEMKAAEEEKVRRQKEQYRAGVEQYFRRKKEQIKEREEDYKKRKEQQKYKKEEEEQVKKEFVKRLYLSNLKREQEVLEKIEEIKENYDDVWKSTEVQQVLAEHKQSLRLLFDLLLKYEKSKISATNYDQIGMATLNFFALKFQIVPFLLQKTDVNKIFQYAIKNDEEKKSSRKGINFDKFIEVIFLIATKGKKILNKIITKRRKKQQKIQAFLNAQKSAGGNHFEAQDVSDSQSSEESSQEEDKPTLQDQYLFNAEDVEPETVEEVLDFLKLPKEKADMEERYKQALETKTSKPRNLLVKQLMQSLTEIS